MRVRDKIKLIAFDVDGTLTKGYSWYRLNKAMGVSKQQDDELVQMLKTREVDVFAVADKVEAYYKNNPCHNKQHMEAVLYENFKYYEGVPEVIDQLRDRYLLAVISGGPHLFVRYVAEALKIPIWRSTHYVLFDKDGHNFVRIWVEGDSTRLKPLYLESIGKQHDIGPDEMMFVGDSFNDIKAFEYVGYPVLKLNPDNRMNTDNIISQLKAQTRYQITNFYQLKAIFDESF